MDKYEVVFRRARYINRVILGPRATDIKKKATYLSCCKNVGRIEKSKIKYV